MYMDKLEKFKMEACSVQEFNNTMIGLNDRQLSIIFDNHFE